MSFDKSPAIRPPCADGGQMGEKRPPVCRRSRRGWRATSPGADPRGRRIERAAVYWCWPRCLCAVSCTADATAGALSWPRTKDPICLLSRRHVRRTSQSPISPRLKRAGTRYKSAVMGGELRSSLRGVGLSTVHTM